RAHAGAATMRSVGKDVVTIKLLGLRNAAHFGKQPLHVIVVTVRRNDLIGIAVRDQHLSTAAFQRMQVRRVGADELRKLLGQIALLGEELLFADRSPVEYRISVDPIAIDALAESAWRSDARRRTPFPAHPHLGAVRIARTI